MSLIENREVAYEAVFMGELPYNPQPEESDIGLSGLWRVYTRKTGGVSDDFASHFEHLPEVVNGILDAQDAAARNTGGETEALFAFVDSNYKETVTSITTTVIARWEKALVRNDSELLFSTTPESQDGNVDRLAHLCAQQSIVFETAAAVMETLPLIAKQASKPTASDKANLARVISNWGPQFLREWMDGSILDRWMEDKKLPADEQTEWRAIFTPGIRKHLVFSCTSDPLAALDRIKANLDLLADDALIAERLSLTTEEVARVFVPNFRSRIAVHNISNPLGALDRIKANLDLLSDDTLLAERLGLSVDEVAKAITPTTRTRLAVQNISKPLDTLDRIKANLDLLADDALIAERLSLTTDEVAKAITPAIRTHIAVHNISDPLGALDRVMANLDLLADDALIAERLSLTTEEVARSFTQGMRRQLALGYITDPYKGAEAFVAGKIRINGRSY